MNRQLPSAGRRSVLRLVTLAAAAALLACGGSPQRENSSALVLLRQQLEQDLMDRVRVDQPNDTTLVVTLTEYGKRAGGAAEREGRAQRAASRVVAHWPDPLLRRVEIVVQREARFGPMTVGTESTRFAFDAALTAAPPPLPAGERALLPLAAPRDSAR